MPMTSPEAGRITRARLARFEREHDRRVAGAEEVDAFDAAPVRALDAAPEDLARERARLEEGGARAEVSWSIRVALRSDPERPTPCSRPPGRAS